jgi:hypothetical protein
MVAKTEDQCQWTFDDFCLWVYCLVDDLWPRIAHLCRRLSPAPACSDPGLATMALIGEAKGWLEETVLLSGHDPLGRHRIMKTDPAYVRGRGRVFHSRLSTNLPERSGGGVSPRL